MADARLETDDRLVTFCGTPVGIGARSSLAAQTNEEQLAEFFIDHRYLVHGAYIGGRTSNGDGAQGADGHHDFYGSDGNDIILIDSLTAGGPITLGGGTDVLELTSAAAIPVGDGTLIVTDFQTGVDGDRVDVSNWLSKLTGRQQGYDPFQTGHFRIVQSGADSVLQIDQNGGGDSWKTLITFQNTTASSFDRTNLIWSAAPGAAIGIPDTFLFNLLTGTEGADSIEGFSGSNHFWGFGGDDVLTGMNSSDTFIGGTGDDVLDGAGGSGDLASYESNRIAGVTVDLAAGVATSSDSGTDTLISIENIRGSVFADVLLGNDGRNLIEGFGGADVIDGRGGADQIRIATLGDEVRITLGTGEDTLVFTRFATLAGELGNIVVTDFRTGSPFATPGAEYDRIDMFDWVTNLIDLTPGASPYQTGHLRLVQDGANSLMQVDRDGVGTAYDWQTLVTFENTTASSFTAVNLGYPISPTPYGYMTRTTSEITGSGDYWGGQNETPRMLADVNGDGRMDLVGFGPDGVYVSLSDADGLQGPPQLAVRSFGGAAGGWLNVASQPREMADVDGDGRADVIGFGSRGVYVSLGQADGTFTNPTLAVAAFGSSVGGGNWASQDTQPRMIGDVNGDGRADIVGFGLDGTYVSLGQADGSFSAPIMALRTFGLAAEGGGWSSQTRYTRLLGDVNGDGRSDVVAFGRAGVWVSLGQADGTFSAPTIGTTSMTSLYSDVWTDSRVNPRLLGDVNGDDRDDIVGFGRDGVYVALADGAGGFQDAFRATTDFATQTPQNGLEYRPVDLSEQSIFLRDMDGDGRMDLVSIGYSGVRVQYFTEPAGAQSGGFSNGSSLTLGFGTSDGYRTQLLDPRLIGDLDGDGLLDLLGIRGDGVRVQIRNPAVDVRSPPEDVAAAKGAGPLALPGLADDDFLPITAGFAKPTDGVGPQILPHEAGLDADPLMEVGPLSLTLSAFDQAVASLSDHTPSPRGFDAEIPWHNLPGHDAFQ
jgi:hypothetical protein